MQYSLHVSCRVYRHTQLWTWTNPRSFMMHSADRIKCQDAMVPTRRTSAVLLGRAAAFCGSLRSAWQRTKQHSAESEKPWPRFSEPRGVRPDFRTQRTKTRKHSLPEKMFAPQRACQVPCPRSWKPTRPPANLRKLQGHPHNALQSEKGFRA